MFKTEEILFRWNAVCAERCMHGVEPGKSRRLPQRLTYGYHILDNVEIDEDVLGEDGLPTGETVATTKTVLRIVVTQKTLEKMAAQYGFSGEQREWLEELLKQEYDSLWNSLLYGVSSVGWSDASRPARPCDRGDGSMIGIAETQLGNIGGEPYWRWYGFSKRVEWCAVFVSWCGEQCGFIDTGVLPKFSSYEDGMRWFKDSGQWQPGGYTPAPGDLIFFDWGGDGVSDHVGIVERADSASVYTIEGNSSDSVARRSYQHNSVKIIGYGML